MRRHLGFALIAAAALAACAAPLQPLNSERIAARFGNYGIEILGYDDGIRYASLYSEAAGARTCRSFAVTLFNRDAIAGVAPEHAQIIAGASIGATFKANGWRVSKYAHHISDIEPPPRGHRIAELMRLDDTRRLAGHVYRIGVKKGAQSIEYATIIEVHHPDYLGVEDLHGFFGGEPEHTPTEEERRRWRELLLAQHPQP